MRIHSATTGWAEIEETEPGELGLPGRLYVRLTEAAGAERVTELYIDGRGKPISPGALRRLPLALIERSAAGTGFSSQGIGPDLSRLATTYATTWGSGTYQGRHCEACQAPLMGGPERAEALGHEQALTDWLALSWISQIPDSGIERPKPHKRSGAKQPQPQEPQLANHTEGLTDSFLQDVARAYDQAIALGRPPAVTLARLAGVEPKTVQSWFYKARKRGLMPPATKKGRIV